MKKALLIVVMFLSIVTLAQAQRGGGQRPSQSGGQPPKRPNSEEMVKRQLEKINEAVVLTDDQYAQVKKVLQASSEERKAQFESMRESGEKPDFETMRAKMDELREKETTAIKAVLSEDQISKYDAYLKEREARMKERMKKGPGSSPDSEE